MPINPPASAASINLNYNSSPNSKSNSKTNVKSLVTICQQVLLRRIDKLSVLGDVPLDLLAPIFDHMNAQELAKIESLNPDILDYTNFLWEKFFVSKPEEFRKQLISDTTRDPIDWRNLYNRLEIIEENHSNKIIEKIRNYTNQINKMKSKSKLQVTHRVLSDKGVLSFPAHMCPSKKGSRPQLSFLEKTKREVKREATEIRYITSTLPHKPSQQPKKTIQSTTKNLPNTSNSTKPHTSSKSLLNAANSTSSYSSPKNLQSKLLLDGLPRKIKPTSISNSVTQTSAKPMCAIGNVLGEIREQGFGNIVLRAYPKQKQKPLIPTKRSFASSIASSTKNMSLAEKVAKLNKENDKLIQNVFSNSRNDSYSNPAEKNIVKTNTLQRKITYSPLLKPTSHILKKPHHSSKFTNYQIGKNII